jgi:hypothetical protein
MSKDLRPCCDTCCSFDEDTVPCSCLAGHGKVSYHRTACEDYREGLSESNGEVQTKNP